MKRKTIYILLIVSFVLTGCGQAGIDTAESAGKSTKEVTAYTLQVTSEITEDSCFICGKHERSRMPYYEKRDSVGLIHWNDLYMFDTEVRAYDDDGTELFGEDCRNVTAVKTSGFGNGYGSVMISGNPARGYTEVSAYFAKKDEANFDYLQKQLCQMHLDQITQFYVDQKNYGEEGRIGTTGYALIDFQTKELYTLSDPYRGYFVRDYYVRYAIREDAGELDIFIFYAPERESGGS